MTARSIKRLVATGLTVLLVGGPSERSNASVDVVVSSGRLTASAMAEPLRNVLAALARETGAAVVGFDAAADEPRSFAFADLPLETGLVRMLGERSFTATFAAGTGESRLLRLSLVPSAGVPAMPPTNVSAVGWPARADVTPPDGGQVAGERPKSTPELEEALARGRKAEDRRAALNELLTRGLLETGVVLRAIRNDPDPYVRGEAVRALRFVAPGDSAVREVVAAVADTDADGNVRQIAAALASELGVGEAHSLRRGIKGPRKGLGAAGGERPQLLHGPGAGPGSVPGRGGDSS